MPSGVPACLEGKSKTCRVILWPAATSLSTCLRRRRALAGVVKKVTWIPRAANKRASSKSGVMWPGVRNGTK